MLKRARLGILVFCACAIACATRAGVTWSDVDDERGQAPVAASSRALPSAPAAARRTPSPGPPIDRALQAFTSDRAASRGAARTSPVWTQHWLEVLTRVSDACELPPRASDLGAFVRARATLEVELDIDRRRGVLLPGDLATRVQRTLEAVDESVGELRAISAPGTLAPSPRLDGELVLRAPMVPLIVSSPFGVRADPITGLRRFHAGTDLDAPTGSTVYASASGLVVYAGLQGGYGKHVVVDHGDAVRTHYSHLSEIVVEPGQVLDEGDPVGLSGSTGRSTGPHLHFAVTNAEGEFLDPVAVLDVPFSVIGEQVKTAGHKKLDDDSLRLRLGAGNTVEIVEAR